VADLTNLLERIVKNDALLSISEQATRQGAINPVLGYLGWDTSDLSEVCPEFAVSSGRVDYCLRERGQSRAFIEVKRAGTELDSHQEQLLRYAFNDGVPLAVLTDGLAWWFYLPLRQGSWEERKFFSVDVRRIPSSQAASVFRRFLERETVVSGDAVRNAETELLDRDREARVMRALPEAWRQLLMEPDEMLAELLAEAAAGIAGARPEQGQVTEFLLSAASVGQVGIPPPGAPVGVARKPPARAVSASTSAVPVLARGAGAFTGHNPKAFTLDGVNHPVSTWRDVLTGVANLLIADGVEEFASGALGIRGRKRNYFSHDSEPLFNPLSLGGGQYFCEGNLSANDIVKLVRRLLVAVRGTDTSFYVVEVSG